MNRRRVAAGPDGGRDGRGSPHSPLRDHRAGGDLNQRRLEPPAQRSGMLRRQQRRLPDIRTAVALLAANVSNPRKRRDTHLPGNHNGSL